MSGLGFDRKTGQTLDGFADVEQSLAVIFSTPLNTRVMRRDFGCELFDLIDRPISDIVILAAQAAVVCACSRWEPRFEITNCNLSAASGDGVVTLSVAGNYYPEGHLGNREKVVKDVRFSFDYETKI
ncbi:GPW/gp25 family protein [uncultured Bartonella sp.]|uniref:GPW/gp25 family protein n=1 Tax=uncultured Bartonella sp. TaxID=104108 RepID=UPI0025F1691B|nr:GPW/gp25 family protein [uncultured Bartonella sp.]